ncbi:MAG: putative phage abortive infection protein [Chitinophagaceae bacterium]|nr:putative phage abortive infection protein [Chitinophagaceae bacterium]
MYKDLKDIWSKFKPEERKYLKLGLKLIGLIGAISIIVLPLIFTLPAYFNLIDFSTKGPVGDTVNGIAGPFIALLAAILTFLAFYIQYKANIQQREQFNTSLKEQKAAFLEQEKIWRVERFENRFYELLKLHKSNVEEMNIGDKVFKSKCFVPMFYELRFCYVAVYDFYKSTADDIKSFHEYDKINLMNLAYTFFFFGIGIQSEKHFVYRLNKGEAHLFHQLKSFLQTIQDRYLRHSTEFPTSKYYQHNLPLSGEADERTTEFYYYPFDGHVNRLGHYYRHLYQTATYIVNQDFLADNEKYEYVKTLRAQLTNFEQLLMYYNAIAWFDTEWKELFTKFRLIKNLPLPIADFYIKPEEHFKDEIEKLRQNGIEMFEWHE